MEGSFLRQERSSDSKDEPQCELDSALDKTNEKITFSSLPSMQKRGHKNSYSSLYNMASTEERNSRSHSNQMYDREMILKNSFTEWNEKEQKQANNEQNALS
jgi:hypothetical protein